MVAAALIVAPTITVLLLISALLLSDPFPSLIDEGPAASWIPEFAHCPRLPLMAGNIQAGSGPTRRRGRQRVPSLQALPSCRTDHPASLDLQMLAKHVPALASEAEKRIPIKGLAESGLILQAIGL